MIVGANMNALRPQIELDDGWRIDYYAIDKPGAYSTWTRYVWPYIHAWQTRVDWGSINEVMGSIVTGEKLWSKASNCFLGILIAFFSIRAKWVFSGDREG